MYSAAPAPTYGQDHAFYGEFTGGESADHAFYGEFAGGEGAFESPARSPYARSLYEGGGYPPDRHVGRPSAPLLRVIHVGQFLVRAGIESWLKALVRYCDPRRLRFERFVVTSPLVDPSMIREMPVPIEVGQEASVRRAAGDCDVLLASGPPELAEWIGRARPPLCIFVAHGDGPWSRHILERCSPIIDHVVAVSQAARIQVCGQLPTTVIYNGLDTAHLTRSESRQEVRARFGFAETDFVLGSVMRLSGEKRPERLIEAIARLPPRFKLLIAGWGPLRQKLFELANEIAPFRCAIVPVEKDLGDVYSAFDAFCLPSESEGFGLATLEALFCKVPVITAQAGFAPELLTDRVHFLQCDGTAAGIAQAVEQLAMRPAWAAGLAHEGQRAAEGFGFARRMCREYEDLLARLWADRSRAS
jgi:glycosyltransferase involved in cell wall biosynthesis